MDAVTTAGEAAKAITGDYVMTGILLFLFLLSTGYLVRVIRALVRDNKTHLLEINKSHQEQMKLLVDDHQARLAEINRNYQTNVERMNRELIDLNQKSLETQKELIQTIKENNEIILQNNGASIRLEASIDALLKAVRQAASL